MQAVRILTVALGACVLFATPLAAAPAADDSSWSEPRLIETALRASGVEDPEELTRQREAVQHEIEAITERLDLDRPTVRGARRLHRLLHRNYLLTYVADEDGLRPLLEQGRFNCLSGTLFYGLIARRLGFDPAVVKLPGHLLLRLDVDGRTLDIETTMSDGFDFGYFAALRPGHEPGLTSSRLMLEWPDSTAWSRQRAGPAWLLPLETAVGYAWLNHGWRALEAGEPLNAAHAVLEAEPLLGTLAEREETVSRLLARAFREEYERGRFDEAYEISKIDARLFPTRTTSTDRLLAAALKRIETLADSGDLHEADRVLGEVAVLVRDPADRSRFERRTCPLVAAAAVRTGEFELARSIGVRYAAAEPDHVEVERFLAWIEKRTAGTGKKSAGLFFGPHGMN